jgi:P-type Cu+ transporter
VLFVGDGLNDAAAMAVSDGSIALGSGAALVKSNAQAVLAGERLQGVVEGIYLARAIRSRLRGNLIFAAVYNLFGMTLAATGNLHPVVAALIMAVSSLWVSWRAVRSVQTESELSK